MLRFALIAALALGGTAALADAVQRVGPAQSLAAENIKHADRVARLAAADARVREANRPELVERIKRLHAKEAARHQRALVRLSKAAPGAPGANK